MRTIISIIVPLCIFLFCPPVSGEDNSVPEEMVHSVIRKALQNHPDMKVFAAELSQEKTLALRAAQVPNLEFNSRLLRGPGGNGVEGEYSLLHTFETGGKRKARTAVARIQYKKKELEILIQKQDIVRELVATLYRLGQIRHEAAVVKESIRTYTAQLRTYNRLPGLNPELEVSRHIFRTVLEENQVLLAGISAEETSLLRKAALYTGMPGETLKNINLPALPWPDIPPPSGTSPYSDLSAIRIMEAEGTRDLAESLPWPDLRIGPSITHGSGDSTAETKAGVSFSFTLPLYHRNRGERDHALEGVALAKAQQASAGEKTFALRRSWAEQYNSLRDRIQGQDHNVDSRPSHSRIHALMERGLVSAPLIVEAHRQEYAFLKTYHEAQMRALELLWGIYGIDGIIFREASND